MTPTSPDHAQFESAFDRFRQALWVFMIHKVPHQEAEDLFQTVCLQTYSAFLSMDDPSRLRALAFTIARRRIMDYYRQSYNSPEIFFEKNAPDIPLPEPFSPEQRLYQKAIPKIISGLKEPYREVAMLHFLIGLTASEISEVLGENQNTVKSHINRSKLQIFKKFGQNPGARHATK